MRKTNVLRDTPAVNEVKETMNNNRTKNVADEVLARNLEMEAAQEEEAKRDRTFEEFMEEYEKHIKGEVDPTTRTANRPVTAADDEGSKPAMRKTGMSGDEKPVTPSEKMSRSSAHRSVVSAESTWKYEVPKDCVIEFQKAARITLLDDNYALIAHPFPQIDGEMIIV